MEIIFDPEKDATNKAKQGVSLAAAVYLEWDDVLVWTDDRKEYGEERKSALELIDGRVYFVAYVDRGDQRRIISLRKANLREARHYDSQT